MELPATDSAQLTGGTALLAAMKLRGGDSGGAATKSHLPTWNNLVTKHSLSPDARDRLERVMRVLISSELLVDVVEDDLENVLNALAIAVK